MLLYFYYLLKEIAGGSWVNKYIILFGVVTNISATNENTITHQIILFIIFFTIYTNQTSVNSSVHIYSMLDLFYLWYEL